MDEQVKQFVTDFLGIKEIPTEQQAGEIKGLEEIIQRKINLMVYDKLSTEDLEALEKISDQKEIGDFVLSKIPDLYETIRELATTVTLDFQRA